MLFLAHGSPPLYRISNFLVQVAVAHAIGHVVATVSMSKVAV